MNEIILSTLDHIEGKIITVQVGIASGSVSLSRSGIRDVIASIRNMLGKEVKEYSQLITKTRGVALERLKEHAKELEADAVVGIRFTNVTIGDGTAQILAYGTAVKLA